MVADGWAADASELSHNAGKHNWSLLDPNPRRNSKTRIWPPAGRSQPLRTPKAVRLRTGCPIMPGMTAGRGRPSSVSARSADCGF